MAKKTTLQTIIDRYCGQDYNEDNYSVGGGLDSCKFASNRHEDAKYDAGKLTEGEATQLFKKATGMTTEEVKEVLNYAVPNMEWHHAGKLPKSYGGGMKKTYFLNSAEICDCATNWNSYVEKLAAAKVARKYAADEAAARELRKQEYLKANAVQVSRVSTIPELFIETDREMNGKYGWFSSYGKSYNMTEYFSGWQFETEEKYQEFMALK